MDTKRGSGGSITQTETSLSLSPSLSRCLSRSLSRSRSRSLISLSLIAHSRSCCLSLSFSPLLSRPLSRSLSRVLSLSRSRSCSLLSHAASPKLGKEGDTVETQSVGGGGVGVVDGEGTLLAAAPIIAAGLYRGTCNTTGVFTDRSTGSSCTGGPAASLDVGAPRTQGLSGRRGALAHRLLESSLSSMKTMNLDYRLALPM